MKNVILTPELIKNFRTERSLSQQALATILNVGIISVFRWETGKTKPEGTAAVLAALVSNRTEAQPYGPLASGYAIYRVLKSHFEEDAKKGD